MLDLALAKNFGGFALDVAFTAEGSGVTALFGRSGAGKSSVVRLIAGLDKPDRGHVRIGDEDITALPAHRRRIGLVFQDSRLLPHYGVKGNLLYGHDRTPAAARFVRFDEVVGLLGLETLLARRVATLSGGEKQRVAIGRALLSSPRLLMMDEPVAALDGARKGELLAYIARLAGHFRLPVLYVSHSPEEILRVANRLALIEKGRLLAIGAVEEVMSRADFAAAAGSRTLISVLGAIVEGHDEARGTSRLAFNGHVIDIPLLELAPGSAVRARIPADHVIIARQPVAGLSVRNQIPGKIAALSPRGALVDVTVDIGGPIHAELTAGAVQELDLAPGLEITVLIKSAAVDAASFL